MRHFVAAMLVSVLALRALLIRSGAPYAGAPHRANPRSWERAPRLFAGRKSFVSGHATPAFAAAAALSEYFDNRWYALIPSYTAAFATGFGRIGNDAHWLSDVIGAGLVGVGTSELLLYLHREHAQQPSRFRIFPVIEPSTRTAGLTVSAEW